jgi:hypothetical protein
VAAEIMELKDVILSTLEEIEHTKETPLKEESAGNTKTHVGIQKEQTELSDSAHNETLFLQNMKERIHVLFEGFQSPNNANIEAKVDLTLNFLEYLLSTIETRLGELKK